MDGSIAPLELLRVIDDNAVAGAWAKARAPATYVIMDDGGERRTDGTYVFRSALCKGASDRPSSTRCSNCHKISSTLYGRVKAAVPKREARPSKFEPHSSVI
ncbi:hypothetical protein SO694_00081189 [Aureococcus anophagefferens]|uniref:Cytochrome c domain-containing protein n=1 Tax=Aureococcus anophagefferens TaxID=44056 RepID=A0ABR1G4X0_AURAN